MKRQWQAWMISVCFCLVFSGESQAKPAHPVPSNSVAHHIILPSYRLSLLNLGDTHPAECFWLIKEFWPGTISADGNMLAYKSLIGPKLLFWVSHLPKGAKILYWPPHSPINGDYNSADVAGFTHFCQSKGVIFRFMP